MSAKVMGQVWELDLPFNKAWILMAMADHADHDGKNVFPRLGFIAWKTGYSLRSVKRVVAELRDDGILIPCGYTPGGVVIYRIRTEHIQRKPEFISEDAGRPEGSKDFEPRGPRKQYSANMARGCQTMGCQNDTPLFGTHNRQYLLKKSSTSTGTIESTSTDRDDELERLRRQEEWLRLMTPEEIDELLG